MHAITSLAVGLLLTAACNSQKPQGAPAPTRPNDGSSTMTDSPPTTPPAAPVAPPTSTLEQVKRWAPAGHQVGAAGPSIGDVPGVELFVVSDPNAPIPADGQAQYAVVAIAGGVGQPILEGPAVMRAAIKATQEPVKLAKIAMLVYKRQGELLLAAATDDQRKAKVTAPAVVGGAVEFWVHTTGVQRMLMQGRLDLSTAALAYGQPAPSQNDAIANAIAGLAGTSVSMHAAAVKTLAAACADPAAKKALLDALASHTRDDTRAAAADAAAACGAGAVDALIRAMESDKANTVRWKAATSLGTIGDAKAKPALEKAAKSDSAELQYAASQALKKLK